MKQLPRPGPIIAMLAVAAAPLVFRLPLWMILWCAFCWTYAYFGRKRDWPWPGKVLMRIMTGVGVAAVIAAYNRSAAGLTYIGLLAIMAGLKPLEIRSDRDRMITVILAYFMVITSLLEFENLPVSMHMFISVLVTTAVLIHINHPDRPMRANFRLSGLIMLQAIPLMLVTFLLFPRIKGSIWKFDRRGAARTGFSDILTPGKAASLALNNDLAFRAEFSGKMPDPQYLYWRGITFRHFNGVSWTRDWRGSLPLNTSLVTGTDEIAYAVTLEPHRRKWLFALDMPAAIPPRMHITRGYTLVSRFPVMARYRYNATSFLKYRAPPRPKELAGTLSLPERGNPEARKLAQQWAETAASEKEIVERGLRYIRENPFVYTLEPPLLQGDIIDDFLFRTRRGYCEHYASAFAFLMRAAGVPARIVGGYLGGELNPFGQYLNVRQSDAHVWVEVLLPPEGWVRADPTAAVSPERVRRSVQGREAGAASQNPFFNQFRALSRWWIEASLTLEAINYKWDLWFMGYSSFEQREYLSRLGVKISSWAGMARYFMMGLGLILAVTLAVFILRFRIAFSRRDGVQEAYLAFCSKLAAVGMPRAPSQGPMDYADMIASRDKELADEALPVIRCYISLRYAGDAGSCDEKAFKKMVRRFAPAGL